MNQIQNRLRESVSVLSLLLVLCFWQIAGFLGILPKFILPTPFEILGAMIRDYDMLFFHSLATIKVALLGLGLGVLLAFITAIVMDQLPIFYDILYPLLVVIQTIPTIALAPILVLWLGYGILPKLVLILLTTTFPIIISLLDGFKQCDSDTLILFQLMRAKWWQILWHFKVPASLPYFFAGLRVSVSYAFITTVVSEWLGGFEGLGVYMIQSKKLFQYDTMFTIIILISLISLLGMQLVKVLEQRLLRWQ
ncbi:ABC transporter permease [Streptococcus himalayensis]|uniref:Nitrate ABC transporter permease n=1 Tax=Streptococcus himalayensis TaxID=1888195 RepID=A0A917A2U4_9STRE|nr:ABC transporter permease [Streptococcus himalayensis]GGE23747.1 nitrate ABC transporter permease [Streptococcus himalayensis]